MKKSLIAVFAFLFFSCSSIKPIGDVEILSYQKLDNSVKYELIATNVGGTYKEFNDTRMQGIKTIPDAVKRLVDNVPGGIFLRNAKIYILDNSLVSVQGDVWGIKSENANIKGFAVGNHVIYQKGSKISKAQVMTLKDATTCFIQEFGEEKSIEVRYEYLTKSKFTPSEIKDYIELRAKEKGKKTFNNMFMSTPN
ncbi:hypothetical protein GOQ04_14695 [Emticicia sp. ODNR4P]|nr:hypothetical protein [Emticicia sp. ODNR4P]